MLVLIASISIATPALARYAAIVIDDASGRVLHERNADSKRYPASLTKIMTLYLSFEALKQGRVKHKDRITISSRAARQPRSKLYLKAGSTMTVEDAIQALAIKSANDVATAVAEHLSGTEAAFARQMTAKAHALGMDQTTFRNASGLQHQDQQTTARDMTILARAIRRDFPHYYNYFSRPVFKFRGRTYRNHNNLLRSYSGTEGIKTGYINASGYNLVSAVRRDQERLIGVVFGGRTARTRDRQMRRLLDRGFKRLALDALATRTPLPRQKPAFSTGDQRQTKVTPSDKTPDDGWAVQVGAYAKYKSAKARALQAVGAASGLLATSGVAIQPILDDGARIYRARLIGLDETRARRACDALHRKRLSCVPIPPADHQT